MVLNDIIEQAAGRHSRASNHEGEICTNLFHFVSNGFSFKTIFQFYKLLTKLFSLTDDKLCQRSVYI